MIIRVALLVLFFAFPAQAQMTPETTPVRSSLLNENVYMLTGRGGNLALLTGQDGAVLVDDQFDYMTDRIIAAVAELNDTPVNLVINTHWHWDHSGGNENMAKTGAAVVAHENTRTRMAHDQYVAILDWEQPASPDAALPVMTFNDRFTLYRNGETVSVYHFPNAHTDTDAIIRFETANVVHTGDIYVSGFYPFIDVSTGGTLDGLIAAREFIADLSDEATQIVPGHGPLSNKTEVLDSITMLKAVRSRVSMAIADGMTLDDFLSTTPLGDLDETWALRDGQGQTFAARVYLELTGAYDLAPLTGSRKDTTE